MGDCRTALDSGEECFRDARVRKVVVGPAHRCQPADQLETRRELEGGRGWSTISFDLEAGLEVERAKSGGRRKKDLLCASSGSSCLRGQ